MHHRMVAKLMGFLSPSAALQRFAEGDRAVPARYARAIALYRTGALGSALLTIDGLLKDYPNDPYFHELRGQMLFENGRAAEFGAVLPPRRPAPAGSRHRSRSILRAPCWKPTSRTTTARRCATSSSPARPSRAASTCGA